jgi:hypothetical protein
VHIEVHDESTQNGDDRSQSLEDEQTSAMH